MHPVVARPSQSTPPPSATLPQPMPVQHDRKTAHRRSWYKHFIKGRGEKTKGKGKVSMEQLNTSLENESFAKSSGSPSTADSACRSSASVMMFRDSSRSSAGSGVHPKEDAKRPLHPSTLLKQRLSRHRRTSSAVPSHASPILIPPKEQDLGTQNATRRHSFNSMQDASGKSFEEELFSDHSGPSAPEQPSHRHPHSLLEKHSAEHEPIHGMRTVPEQDRPVSPHAVSAQSDAEGSTRGANRIYPSGSEDGIKSGRESSTDINSAGGRKTYSAKSSVVSLVKAETPKTLLFDYDSLPDEVLGLLKAYETQGHMELVERKIKYSDVPGVEENEHDHEEDEDEEDNDDTEEEDLIDASQLISSYRIPEPTRKPQSRRVGKYEHVFVNDDLVHSSFLEFQPLHMLKGTTRSSL